MESTHTPIDLATVITTPENIAFDYRLAGPFRRLPAYLVDVIACWGMIVLSYIGLLFISWMFGFAFSVSFEVTIFAAIVVNFLLQWFYGIFFELFRNGQTPGKAMFQLRAISADGRPLNAMQAVIRNLMRVADSAPLLSMEMFSSDSPPSYVIPTFLCGFICMIITSRFQRLGDLAAGTIVVVNERRWVPPKIVLEDPRVPSLATYIPPSFRLTSSLARALAMYMDKRSRMHPVRRGELASYLAVPLLKRFGLREDTCPDLLLCAIYYREFVADVQFAGKNERLDIQKRSAGLNESINSRQSTVESSGSTTT